MSYRHSLVESVMEFRKALVRTKLQKNTRHKQIDKIDNGNNRGQGK